MSMSKLSNNNDFSSVTEQLYYKIRHDIIDGVIQPGEKLIERSLADKYSVSRTPVREALRRLTESGFVQYFPRKGMVATTITISQAKEVFIIRENLEGIAAREAALNANEQNLKILKNNLHSMHDATLKNNVTLLTDLNTEFHLNIKKMNDMPILRQMLDNVWDQIIRLRAFSLAEPGRPNRTYQEHLDIYNFISKKDYVKSEEAMREHVKQAKNSAISKLEDKNIP